MKFTPDVSADCLERRPAELQDGCPELGKTDASKWADRAAVSIDEMTSPRPFRRLVALAALVALCGGFAGVHDGAAAHSAGEHGQTVYACDLEHGRATHVESARELEPHDCAACLHRLHSRGGAPDGGAVVGLAAADRLAVAPEPAAAPFPPLSRAPSRGPPLV
jgi:hypothetical protein